MQEWIACPLAANAAGGAMTTDELHIIWPLHQFVLYGRNQCIVVSAGEICSADGATKQHIAHVGEFCGLIVEYYMTGCVARAVKYLKLVIGKGNFVAFI